jgi:regulator of sigma E protease
MHFLPSPIRAVAAFAVVLGVLVFIHELGHYLAARWRGVHVEAFSIGFGPRLFGWTDRVGTEWKLSLLPLGGYVKLHGAARPEDVGEEDRAAYQSGRTLFEKSVASRAIVVAAGPAANFVLAVVLFALLFGLAGRPVAQSVVSTLVAGGAAETAGLHVGDRIQAIDGRPTPRFEDLQAVVGASAGQRLSFSVLRDGAVQTLPVVVGSKGPEGHPVGMLGIGSAAVEFERVGPGRAVLDGFGQTWKVMRQTVVGYGQIFSGQVSTRELSGPLGIAQMSGQVAELGFASLVSFIALLSVNLGLINLFPIPVLDGGYLLFYAAEAIRGRPIPVRALEYGFRAGFALIACLFVVVTWNDLSHLGVMHWVASLFG